MKKKTGIHKFILRRVDVKDYSQVTVKLDRIVKGDTLICLCYQLTGEIVEIVTLTEEVEKCIVRNAKIDSIVGKSLKLTDREIYLGLKSYYADFDDIYYGILFQTVNKFY